MKQLHATNCPGHIHADNERDADLVELWWQAHRGASSQLLGDARAPAAAAVLAPAVTVPAPEAALSMAARHGSEEQWLSVPVLAQAE